MIKQLMELLYIAYNRDESEVLQLSKMVNAQYDSLYSSGKDVLDKKKEKLDREIKKYEATPSASPEVGIIRNYIDYLLEIPWSKKLKPEPLRPSEPVQAGQGRR